MHWHINTFSGYFLKHKFQLLSYNIRDINEDNPLKRGGGIAFLNDIIYYMLPLQNAIISPILYDTNYKCNKFASFQQIILNYILYCSWIIKIYVLKK